MKNYKLAALIPLFVLAGCKKYEHKNVITAVVANDTEIAFILDDVETHQQKIFKASKKSNRYSDDYKQLKIGDTVTVHTGGKFRSDKNYNKQLILYFGEVGLEYDVKALCKRQELINQEIKNKAR